MHSSTGRHGGDLNTDTVTIIGATLDLQEKVVRQVSYASVACIYFPSTDHRVQAMTPINDVFMLSIDSKLDYETLRKICATGHSRVPVYERVEVPASGVIEARNKAGSTVAALPSPDEKEEGRTIMVKRIVGIFLVKQVGDLATPSIQRAYINRNYNHPVCSPRSQRYVCLSQKGVTETSNQTIYLSPQMRFPFAR